MQRNAERRPDVALRERIGERDHPRLRRRFAGAAARKQTSEASDDVGERDARREFVARRPQRETDAPDVPERDDDGEDEAAVEHAARTRQREQLVRIRLERPEIGDQQQQLRADERADDDVDAEVEHAVRVEAARLRANHRELQADQIRRGEQDAVRVQRDRPELKQSWIHLLCSQEPTSFHCGRGPTPGRSRRRIRSGSGSRLSLALARRPGSAGPPGASLGPRALLSTPSMSRIIIATPTVIAESATLNAQKWYECQYTSTKSTTDPAAIRSSRLPA